MYVRFVGFGVGHAIQYDRFLTENTEEEDIFDEIFEDDTNTNSCDSETPCDTDIGADGNTREDVFEDDEEASENSDVEDEFSGMEVHESEDEERPEFRFWALTLTCITAITMCKICSIHDKYSG